MVAPRDRNAMPNLDALILPKREQLATPAPGFAHTRAIADRCFVERLPRLDAPLLLFEGACAWTRRHGAGSHAALATLDNFENSDVNNASRRTALPVSASVEDLAADLRVSNFHNSGMIWAFNVATDDSLFARRFQRAAMANGLSLCPIRNTVYFMPPYVIGKGNSSCKLPTPSPQ